MPDRRSSGRPAPSVCFALIAGIATVSAPAQSGTCAIEPFQGATLPQGAVTRMRVANTASSCAITLYGLPSERANAADSGHITKQPAHGKAEFAAPDAKYFPQPGYLGEDSFEFEAFASGKSNQRVHLRVRVQVQVVAP